MSDEPFIKKHMNADGTYNGVGVLHDLVKMLNPKTDITQAEIDWTWRRMKVLIQTEGKSKEVAKAIVREECKEKPWLKSR